MNLDPFGDPFRLGGTPTSDVFQKTRIGGARAPRKADPPPEPESEPETQPESQADAEEGDAKPAADEKPGEKVVLQNPKWEVEEVGFNEETEVSVEAQVPEAHAHKTKVDFELFAKIPAGDDPKGGKESISKAQGSLDGGAGTANRKAKAKIPVYMPQYKDEGGNLLAQVEYYFTAKHSASDLLEDASVVKVVDHMADRFLESHVVEDVTFATGKSFLSPGQAPALRSLVASIKAWKGKHPDGKLAVFGHADAVGNEDPNKALSERRATCVFAFLVKDPDLWKTLYDQEKWGLVSTQDYLRHLGHDPGASDGQDGPKTQAAVKSFQASKKLAESGSADAATRGALYDAFMASCNGEPIVPKDFDAIDGKPHAGCSEFNLLENTKGASPTNRRVAVFLLKSNKNFPIQYPCKHGDIGACKKQVARKGARRTAGYSCLFYDQLIKEEKKGGGGGEVAAGKIKAFVHSTEKELKHFVNIKDGAGTGKDIELEVEVEGSVTKVYWKATAGAKNSKKSKPAPGWVATGAKDSTPLKGGVGEFESEVKDGKSKATFRLGLSGGDEFTFEVGTGKGKKELEQKVITWRRLWYQLTYRKGITPPSMDTAVKQLKDVFIDWVAEKPHEHEIGSAGNVIVGNHNAGEFHKLLTTTHTDQCAHIILCDKQYDGLENGVNITVVQDAIFETATDNIKVSNKQRKIIVPNPPVQKGASLLLSGKWKNASTGKSGTLTIDESKATADIGLVKWLSEHWISVDLPANATPSTTKSVSIEVELTAANGPWGGDGGTAPHNLIVINSSDTIHTQCCLHELGHIINMVPLAGYYRTPDGYKLSDHTHSYDEMGGSGSHCSWEIDKTKSSSIQNVDGKCIMFHQLNSNCKLIYCPECAPLVKAQSLEKFHELKD